MSPTPFSSKNGPNSIDPYVLLGLDAGANDGGIQSAFRRASLHVHPDRCPGDPDAARKFHQLTEAKDLLLDPLRRRVYDRSHCTKPPAATEAWWADWDELFAELEADEMQLERRSGHTYSGLEGYLPAATALPRGLSLPEQPLADVLVVGATGVVGTLATALLCKGALGGRSWMIAGRDSRKLRLLEAKLGGGPGFQRAVSVETAENLASAVRASRVVIDLTGPEHTTGTSLAEICVRLGRHYVHNTCDVTYSKLLREKLQAKAKANGVCLVMHVGSNSLLPDFVAWMLVRYLRERHRAPTRRIDLYGVMDGWLLSGSCFQAVSHGGGLVTGAAPNGDNNPFLLGGVRGTGVREEDKECKEQPLESKALQVHCIQGALLDRLVVRASCGLMDSVQPYGRRFSFGNWLPYKDKQDALESTLQSLIALKKLQELVKEKKLPAPGSGPSKRWRCRSRVSVIGVATSEPSGKEGPKVVHALSTFEPGMALSDRCEGTALMCLDAASTLLDAIDGGQGKLLRPGWGTPVYHLAHLGFAKRLVQRGLAFNVADGELPAELLHNTMDSTLTLEE